MQNYEPNQWLQRAYCAFNPQFNSECKQVTNNEQQRTTPQIVILEAHCIHCKMRETGLSGLLASVLRFIGFAPIVRFISQRRTGSADVNSGYHHRTKRECISPASGPLPCNFSLFLTFELFKFGAYYVLAYNNFSSNCIIEFALHITITCND